MRGEVWTIAAGGPSSKPRPAVIIQSDEYPTEGVVIVCPLTTFGAIESADTRTIEPTQENGLTKPSMPMPSRIGAIKSVRLGIKIGVLSEKEMSIVSDSVRRMLAL